MTGIADIFLSPLQGFLSTLQNERHYKDKNIDDALIAIQRALIETQRHVELSGPERDRDKEYDLALLWREASIKARRAKIPFAKALSDKSDYWQDQEIWKEDQIVAKGIKFDQINAQINELLSRS
jgi:hypothetical protein